MDDHIGDDQWHSPRCKNNGAKNIWENYSSDYENKMKRNLSSITILFGFYRGIRALPILFIVLDEFVA